MANMDFKEGRCPKAKFCIWKQLVYNDDYVMEYCTACKREVYYKVVDGQIDNKLYKERHIRDFCQPTGATAKVFEQVYGRKAMESFDEIADQGRKSKNRIEALDHEYKKEMKIAKLE